MPERVLIASDQKRGHENQSRVLSRMLGDSDPLVMHLRQGAAGLLLRARMALGGRSALSQAQAADAVKRFLTPEKPGAFRHLAQEVKDAGGGLRLFCVSSGTAAATMNLALARLLGARSVVNMTPSLLPRKHFDLNVVPSHDLQEGASLPGNVVLTPLALGYHDTTAAEFLAGRLCRESGLDRDGRYAALAIGGPSRSAPWQRDVVLGGLAKMLEYAEKAQCRLFVTTSRRTPDWCAAWLKEHYAGDPSVAYFLDASSDSLNPLPAFCELAQVMFVTGDSFSMVSEVIHAGHKPLVLAVSQAPGSGKIARSLNMLEQRGLAVLLGPNAQGSDFESAIADRGAPNKYYDELRREVRARLGL
ncbi:mitochondrial fission ELM1 family protein [bacterium]|nr:mitochondrial fission ELM1 family protein [bacterium]